MSNTYTQLYVHAVFAVKYRQALLSPEWDDRLRHYITAIVQNGGNKMLAINNMPDHIHLFFGMHPTQSVSVIMQQVKADSTKWINQEKLTKHTFTWQNGYGAFSHAKSQVDTVVKYIHNQQTHHAKKSLVEEYKTMLTRFEVVYDDKYLFKEPE